MEHLIGGLLGLGVGTALIACIQIPRYIKFCRRLDREFALYVKMEELKREIEWRAAGLSEEIITEVNAKIKAACEAI